MQAASIDRVHSIAHGGAPAVIMIVTAGVGSSPISTEVTCDLRWWRRNESRDCMTVP